MKPFFSYVVYLYLSLNDVLYCWNKAGKRSNGHSWKSIPIIPPVASMKNLLPKVWVRSKINCVQCGQGQKRRNQTTIKRSDPFASNYQTPHWKDTLGATALHRLHPWGGNEWMTWVNECDFVAATIVAEIHFFNFLRVLIVSSGNPITVPIIPAQSPVETNKKQTSGSGKVTTLVTSSAGSGQALDWSQSYDAYLQ